MTLMTADLNDHIVVIGKESGERKWQCFWGVRMASKGRCSANMTSDKIDLDGEGG